MPENADPMSALREAAQKEAADLGWIDDRVRPKQMAFFRAALRASIPPETPTRVVVTGGDHADSEGRACYHATPAPSLEGARHPEALTADVIEEALRRKPPGQRTGEAVLDAMRLFRHPEAGETERLTLQGWSLDFDAIDRWLVLTDPDGAAMIVAKDVDLEYGGDIAGHWRIAERLTATPAALNRNEGG